MSGRQAVEASPVPSAPTIRRRRTSMRGDDQARVRTASVQTPLASQQAEDLEAAPADRTPTTSRDAHLLVENEPAPPLPPRLRSVLVDALARRLLAHLRAEGFIRGGDAHDTRDVATRDVRARAAERGSVK